MKPFQHRSLRIKIALGLLIPLTVVMAGSSYLRYISYRDALMAKLESLASSTGRVLARQLALTAPLGLPASSQQIVDTFATQDGLQDLSILDATGRVIASTNTGLVGSTVDLVEIMRPYRSSVPQASASGLILRDRQNGDFYRSIERLDTGTPTEGSAAEDGPVYWVIADYSLVDTYALLATYRRSRLVLTLGSMVLILLTADLMLNRIVTNRLKQFLRAVKRVSSGDLSAKVKVTARDELGQVAEAFNAMADELQRKSTLVDERTSELQAKATRLAALNTLALTVSQSLDLGEVLDNALDQVLNVTRMKAGWVVLCEEGNTTLVPLASRGLPEKIVRAQEECSWSQSICFRVLRSGGPTILSNAVPHRCPVAQHFETEGLVLRACVPLQSKDHILGAMTLVGDGSSTMQELAADATAMLETMGRQIGIAVENARLYEQLQLKEGLRRQLLQRLLTAQEEERRRISRELHDQTGQSLSSLIMTLKVMEDVGVPVRVRPYIEELRNTAAHILAGVRNLALQLRPSALDDLGLLAALRHYVRECEQKLRVPISFQTLGIDEERLAPEVETTLYRIAQEALTNVARHAGASDISVLLQKRDGAIKLIVEDNGRGFDVARIADSRTGEGNLGLHGMRERAALLRGTVTIESTAGKGTTIFVEIPLHKETGYEKDPLAGG